MEFRFDLHPIFNQSIIKVNSNLLPAGFRGDRRIALDTATKLAEVINEMGEASARAQGLSNPVTTAQKLRMTDQNIYLLGDPTQGKNGAVVGLLKVGKKSLYVFDENGKTQMVNAPCVLDFYVHESRQRSGLGRNLFDTMLQYEEFVPQKLAVDRPSDKLLGFLRKHYGLQKTIPQMNNFVVYDGFFEKLQPQGNNVNNHDSRMHITASPNTALFGPQFVIDEKNKKAQAQKNASNTSIPLIQSSPVGRYAAPRPMGSMAECLSCAEVDQNINRPAPSNVSVSKQMPPPNIETNASSAQVNRISPTNTMLNSRNSPPPAPVKSVPSNASIKRSNSGLNDVAVSNSSIIRQRAAGLPSQNYAQYGDNQVTLSEIAMPAQSQGNVVVNPAEPIGKTNLVMQDIKTPAIEIEPPVENPNEIFHEVCPNCSATFLSTRNSTVKVVQSKVSNANQQTNVGNNQVNDAIIHNTAAIATGEPNSLVDNPPSATEPYHCVLNETNDIVDLNIDDLQISEHEYNIQNNGEVIELSSEKTHDELTNGHRHKEVKIDPNGHYIELEAVEPIIEPVHIQKPTSFPHSKQHTGLKNISYNVSLAVSPTSKMDFVQRPSVEPKQKSPLEDKAAGLPSHDNIDTDSTSSGAAAGAPYTDHGYFDLKFYHNRLW